MPLLIIDEAYNSLPSLYANAGKWVSAEVKLRNSYRFGSGNSNKINTIGVIGFEVQSGIWGALGFAPGDTITITFFKYDNPGATQEVTLTREISYIDGNKMYFTVDLPSYLNSRSIPTDGLFSGADIRVNKSPEQIDLAFNLSMNGTNTQSSVIDEEMNRFKAVGVDSLAVSGSINMIQLGNKSGGIIKDVVITRTVDTTFSTPGFSAATTTEKNYTITFKFVQWGLFKDGNTAPIWYFAADNLKTNIEVKTYALTGDPNGLQTKTGGVTQSNTGWFDENFNGNPSSYALSSFDLLDNDGNALEKVNYAGETNFTAVFDAPNQLNGTSVYRIGLFFAPIDEALFKNLPLSLENNAMLNVPEVDFMHSSTPDVTVYTGAVNSSGVGFDITDLMFSHSSDVLTVTGKITPTSQAVTLFDSIHDGGRNLIGFVQISDYTKTGTASDEVNVVFYNDDVYNAPRIGVQYPDVVTDVIFDHASQDVTAIPFTTTIEDDVKYVGNLLLIENEEIDGIRVGVYAYNEESGESFTLEETFFDFSNVPFIDGVYQPNEEIGRGFLLPPDTDRNNITLTRNEANDITGKYGVEINYGFLDRWQYWLEQANVNDELFDSTQPFNGKNKNWWRLQNPDWGLRIAYFVRKEDVDDFNYTSFKIANYEADPDITTTVTFTDQEGNTVTALPKNQIVYVHVNFQWTKVFSEEWFEAAVETFEGERVGFISSFLDHGGIATNAMLPEAGEDKARIVNNGTDIDVFFRINTGLIDVNNVSISYRVYSTPLVYVGFLINSQKDAAFGYSVQRISSFYTGQCMRVRRSSDDTEKNFGFSGNTLDVSGVETFLSGYQGFVSVWYDQALNNNPGDAIQLTHANQAQISDASGIVHINADTGLPVVVFTDGCFYNTNNASQRNKITELLVVKKEDTGDITLRHESTLTTLTFRWRSTDLMETGYGSGKIGRVNESGTDTYLIASSANRTTGEQNIYQDGVLLDNEVDPLENKNYDRVLLNNSSTGNVYVHEYVYFLEDLADDSDLFDAVHTNIMTRYGL